MSLADADPAASDDPKAKVFISYSRRDLAFADHIDTALKARGFDTLIDRSEIYALEDWWKRIEALIAQADTIVFILSPDAVASEVCQSEVRFAASLNKRLAPIVFRRVADSAVPPELARLNFIFFDDEALFDASLDRLAEALGTDIDWVRKHTEFGEHARRWMIAGRPGPRGLLLRPPALDEAERWIASRPHNAPPPTEAAQAFIAMSRQAHTRRRNIVSATLAAGLFVSLGLAGLAFWQRGVAVAQRTIAQQQQVGMLAELADAERGVGRPLAALRIAVLAAQRGNRIGGSFPQRASAGAGLSRVAMLTDWRLLLGGHEAPVSSAAFSPDGSRIVTGSADKTARVWDAASGTTILTLRGHTGPVRSAVFSPDGSRILTASDDKTARVWDAVSGKELLVLQGHKDIVYSAAFSPDGSRIVTGSNDKTARVWDAVSGKELFSVGGDEDDGHVLTASFSPDGARIVTAGADTTVWDAATGDEIITFDGAIIFAAFSPDGSRIVAGSMNAPQVLDAATGKRLFFLSDTKILSAAFSPDGSRIVSASEGGIARLWDATNGKELGIVGRHERNVVSAAFSPDGERIVTASDDATARVWMTAGRQPLVTLRGHRTGLWFAGFSPDGSRVVSAAGDNTARVWDAATGKELVVLRSHDGGMVSAAFDITGTRIVTGSWDKTVLVWDAASGKENLALLGHQQTINSVAFSPDDAARILTASSDGTARVWDAASGSELLRLGSQGSSIDVASFSPDGKRVVTGSADGMVQIWDAASGKRIVAFRGHEKGGVRSATFSPDGTRILTASYDGTAKIWDAVTGREMLSLQGHQGAVLFAAFNADGTRVATASFDNTARIWDAANGKELIALRGHQDQVFSAVFSPDSTRVVTASDDKTALIWDVSLATMPTGKLLAEVCTRKLRGVSVMTRDEMRLIGEPDDAPPIDVCAGIEPASP